MIILIVIYDPKVKHLKLLFEKHRVLDSKNDNL